MNHVLCFGEALIDFLPSDNDPTAFTPIAGGAPANVAVAIAKLGGDSAFIGAVSQDNFGQLIIDELTHYQVNTQAIKRIADKNTAVVLVSLDKDNERSFNFYRHDTADVNFFVDDFNKKSFEQASIFHFCSNTLTTSTLLDSTMKGLSLARQHNHIISFDVNLRKSLWNNLDDAFDAITQCFNNVDIIKFSKEELDSIALRGRISSNDLIVKCLTSHIQMVIITDGSEPINVYLAGAQKRFGVPKITAKDTTGAGDSFVGGLLYQLASHGYRSDTLSKLLSNDEQLGSFITFSSTCGAYTCQQKGAFPALPRQQDIS